MKRPECRRKRFGAKWFEEALIAEWRALSDGEMRKVGGRFSESCIDAHGRAFGVVPRCSHFSLSQLLRWVEMRRRPRIPALIDEREKSVVRRRFFAEKNDRA